MARRALKRLSGVPRLSLLDLLLVLVVLVLLLMAAAPSIGAWGADAHIRSTAQALQSGLRLAQGEALRRDRHSAFVLTLAAPALGAKPIANGENWYVRTLPASGSDGRDGSEEGAAAKEHFVGGGHFAWPSVSVTGPAALCFDPIGRPAPGLAAGAGKLGVPCAPADAVTYVVSSPADGTHTLWVHVNPDGRVQVCHKASTPRSGGTDDC